MKNISESNVKYLPCDKKCEYSMYYKKEQITSTNTGNSILIAYNGSDKSAIYASDPYSIQSIMIVQPSIHTFVNNSEVTGEIIIKHTIVDNSNSNILNVCIPIITSTSLSKGSDILTSIIKSTGVSKNATSSNISPFSIMDIMPEKPFYFYTSNNNTIDIVFDINDAISINSETTNTLANIITAYTPNKDDYLYTNNIFKSAKPPINGALNNDIYIDCMPTDEGEYKDSLINKPNFSSNVGLSLSKNTMNMIWTILTIFIIILIFIGIAMSINYGMRAVSGSKELKHEVVNSVQRFLS